MKARPGLLIYRRKGMGLVLAVDEAGTVTVMWTRPGGFEPRLTTYSSDGWKWVLAVNEPVNIWVPAESTRSAPNSGMNALTTDGNAGQKTQDRAEAEPSSTPEERERERDMPRTDERALASPYDETDEGSSHPPQSHLHLESTIGRLRKRWEGSGPMEERMEARVERGGRQAEGREALRHACPLANSADDTLCTRARSLGHACLRASPPQGTIPHAFSGR